MSNASKGARLYFEQARFKPDGRLKSAGAWIIRDGASRIRTGCGERDRAEAERKLAQYLTSKYTAPTKRKRHPDQILVADVIKLYQDKEAPTHERPHETDQRLISLLEWWTYHRDDRGNPTREPIHLGDINGDMCRSYVAWRTAQVRRSAKPEKTGKPARPITESMARRELEDLRSAINYHRREGYCSEVVGIVLPAKSQPRTTWLTRPQAARLLWAAWRAKQVMRDKVTARDVGKHVARFILVGLYTGTRSAAICGASFQPAIGRGHVDVENGLFIRRAKGAHETNKRQPTAPIPPALLTHLRRWQRLGIGAHAVVEWNGKPIKSVKNGFAAAVRAAGLPTHGPDRITPHVLRHTAATWMMAEGEETWTAAAYLGMSEKILREVYAHTHHEMMRGMARRIGRGTQMKRLAV